MLHLTVTRTVRPLSTIALCLLLGACGSANPSPNAISAGSAGPAGSPGAGAGASCATAPAPPSNLQGWQGGAKTSGLVPSIISSQQSCGRNRLLFGFTANRTNSNGQQETVSVASPDRSASVALYNLARDPNKPTMTVEGTFQWAIEDVSGVYVAQVVYPEAGEWGAAFTTAAAGAAPETIKVRFDVQAESVTPPIGGTVPAVKTPTLTDAGVDGEPKKIASDPSPDPRFYQLSEDQALAQHKPFVLVFATPAFCQSAVCGPTLEKIKAIASEYPSLTFINVEPYKMQFTNGRLQPVLSAQGQLQPNEATEAFSLLSEPWIFVVDGKGVVTGSFETLAGPEELKAAIDAALQG